MVFPPYTAGTCRPPLKDDPEQHPRPFEEAEYEQGLTKRRKVQARRVEIDQEATFDDETDPMPGDNPFTTLVSRPLQQILGDHQIDEYTSSAYEWFANRKHEPIAIRAGEWEPKDLEKCR